MAYSLDSVSSNRMKSKNPHSGCRAVEATKTIDTSDQNPGKNQGGICVVERYFFENNQTDARCTGPLETATTLKARMGTGGNNCPLIIEQKAYCLQGNGIDRADTAGCNGSGWKEDEGYTINTVDRHAVVYAMDGGFCDTYENESTTLTATDYKRAHIVHYKESETYYIVRRLMPVEYARLQGFKDTWGEIETKDDMTDEEYRFWKGVRNTHAAANGKAERNYTKKAILTWYNHLHTDAAEYKMWGNGIALPPALYCMQGIAQEMKAE